MSKFCPSCGKQLNDTAMFCEHCGTKLSAASQNETETNQVFMSMPEITSPENDDDNSVASMLRNRSYEEKPKEKKSGKKIAIAVLAFLVVCASGVLAYLLLTQEPEEKPLKREVISSSEAEKTESVIEEIIPTSDEDSRPDESSEAEPEAAEWEIRTDVEIPEKELEEVTETVNDHEVKKFSTGINDSYYDFVSYYKAQYGSNVSYSQYKTEDVYTRQSQGNNYTGLKDNYNIIVNANTRDGESVVLARSNFGTYTAHFDGASSFSLEMHDEEGESISAFQTACYERLKTFMDEKMADFLVYGQGKVYYGEENTKDLDFEYTIASQEIELKASRTVEIDKRKGFKATFDISYELLTNEAEQTPYFDGSSPEIYNNASIRIADFIPVLSDASQTDCSSSHEFMKNVMSNFTLPDKKFIDTKLDSMNVTEMVSEDDTSKTKNTFGFRVSSGISGMKYEDAPYVDFSLEATKDDKSNYSDCKGTIYGNLRTSDEPKKNVDSVIAFLKAIYPNIASSNIPADKVVEALKKHQPFEIDVKIGAAWSSNIPAHLVISDEEGTCFTLTFGVDQFSSSDNEKEDDSSVGLEEDLPPEDSSKTAPSSSSKPDSSSVPDSSSQSENSSKAEDNSSEDASEDHEKE